MNLSIRIFLNVLLTDMMNVTRDDLSLICSIMFRWSVRNSNCLFCCGRYGLYSILASPTLSYVKKFDRANPTKIGGERIMTFSIRGLRGVRRLTPLK